MPSTDPSRAQLEADWGGELRQSDFPDKVKKKKKGCGLEGLTELIAQLYHCLTK